MVDHMINSDEIKEIIREPELFFDTNVTVKGWVRTYRKQAELCFMNLNDGSEPRGIQIICAKKDDAELFDMLDKYNVGCYLKVQGQAVRTPDRSKEPVEIKLHSILDEGLCEAVVA